MKFIVTGAAGFIGSHLSELLIEEGHTVIALDDFSTGREKNLKDLKKRKTFKFVKTDVSVYEPKIEKLFKDVDVVFHLAALADIVPSIQNPQRYFNANVTGTMQVLEYARAHKVRKIVYAASSSCYGLAVKFPTPEQAAMRPMYPYALTKYLGEQLILHYQKVYGIHATSLRLFNVYGPRARTTGSYGAVMGVFLAQMANERPLTVVGNGEQSRDFIHVHDVAEAFYMASKYMGDHSVFNIAYGEPHTINQLISVLGGGKRVCLPWRPGEPKKTHADISRAQKHLGWSPTTTFSYGVYQMRKMMPEFKDAPVWDKDKIKDATKDWFTYMRDE